MYPGHIMYMNLCEIADEVVVLGVGGTSVVVVKTNVALP